MKRVLFLLLAAALSSVLAVAAPHAGSSVTADEATVTIGYCPDELSAQAQAVGLGVEGDARVSAAICLPRTTLMHYRGMQLTRLRFAVVEGLTDVSVWVRTSLGSSSLAVQSVDDVASGWNEVALRTPLTIDGSELFIGFTATQAEGFRGILADGEGRSGLSSWLAVGSQWSDYSASGVGSLYIQAVAEGTLPPQGPTVIGLTTDAEAYNTAETLLLQGEVENLSRAAVSGTTLLFAIDGGEVARQTLDATLQPDGVAAFSQELSLDGLAEGRHELTASVPPGEAMAATFYVYTEGYERTVLLEHFTSLPCVNCPEADRKLEAVVANRSQVAWVAHHVGYADDEFTLAASQPLVRYGVNGNPYIMLNRTDYREAGQPAFTIGGYSTAFLGEIFDYVGSLPALLRLEAAATASGSELTVSVEGEARAFLPDLYPRATLHVYLVEDSVVAEGTQAGDAGKKTHDNILRLCVTPLRGSQALWQTADGAPTATLAATLTATLDPAWRAGHLRVVAFLATPAPAGSGYLTGAVLNAVQTPVADAAAIADAKHAAASPGQWHSLDGRRIAQPSRPGIYIHNGKKTIVKETDIAK